MVVMEQLGMLYTKMEVKQTLASTLIAGLLIVATMLIPGTTQYFCPERPELGLVECDSFSKYVDENGKCVRNDKSNLICRSGWLEVKDDIESSNKIEVEFNGIWTCESSEPTAVCSRGDHRAYYNQII